MNTYEERDLFIGAMDEDELRELLIGALGETCLIDNIECYFGSLAIKDCYRDIINTYGFEFEEFEDDEK